MIRLELPWIPPSSNTAYFNSKGRGRILSDAGRAFKLETKLHFVQKYPQEMRLFQLNKPYLIFMRFYFDDIENKGFTTGKAQSRYKTFDGGNRTKLLEDALKDAGGIDDSQTMVSIWEKRRGADHGVRSEMTVLWAWCLNEETTPFDQALEGLR